MKPRHALCTLDIAAEEGPPWSDPKKPSPTSPNTVVWPRGRFVVSSRVRSAFAAVACVALILSACSSDDAPKRGSTADAYAVVIRWFVDHSGSDQERPTVFVEALGEGVGIGLDTQAAVVSSTGDFAEVKFIDDRSEALSDEGVRDGGIFIALGPAVESERSVTIDAAEIESDTESIGWTFDLISRAGTWTLTDDPVRSD